MRTVLTVSSVAVLAAALAGCGHEPAKVEAEREAPPAQVKVVKAEQREWPDVYEATGTVRARTSAAVSARVMGVVREVRVSVGSRVSAGEPLAVIDARDLETGLRRAEAGLAEANSMVPEVNSAVAVAGAQLKLAEATYRRMKELAAKKSVSDQELDEAAARYQAAQAAHQGAEARHAQVRARIEQAAEEKRSAEIALSWTRITAPFAGVVTSKSVEPGAMAMPGMPLLVIEQEGHYRLEAGIEESRVIRAGDPVTVALDAIGESWQARVGEVAPAVDAGSRSFVVKIDLPASPRLRSGQYGRVRFGIGTRPATAVPDSAIADNGQLRTVMVAEGGRARSRMVTTGRSDSGMVEILSGLSAGETVIAPKVAGLEDGRRVEIAR